MQERYSVGSGSCGIAEFPPCLHFSQVDSVLPDHAILFMQRWLRPSQKDGGWPQDSGGEVLGRTAGSWNGTGCYAHYFYFL